MIVDQGKAQREIEVRKREEFILEKIKQESRQVFNKFSNNYYYFN